MGRMKLFSYLGIITGVISENCGGDQCNLHAFCNDAGACQCKTLSFLGHDLAPASTSTGVGLWGCKYVHPNDSNVVMDVIVNDHTVCGEDGCVRNEDQTIFYDKVYAPFAVYNTGVKVKTVREAGKMCSKLGMR